ncbi:MAG: lytic transglycosylase domain-containing protein [Synergistaceae bacterium]|jgi:soluble lytic murein transglycosylase|nr:lytic transglycosylase domain-containing protein [Synergistaceae bacterium]
MKSDNIIARFSRKFLFPAIFSIAAIVFCAVSANTSNDIESSFWSRDWHALDEIYSSAASGDIAGVSSPLSAREKSIYVNALWLQGRYEESVSVLESILQDFPDGLRAYADMLFVLGTERTGRKEEAYGKGLSLWESGPPENMRYYVAYAIARLSRDLSMKDESVVWFRRMYDLASDKKHAVQALSQIIELGGAGPEDAAALLINSPTDKRALALLADAKAGTSGLVEYALGYRAYIGKKYGEAMAHFELASKDIAYGEAARYYHAYSAYREKKDDTAYKLWSDLALTGFDYPQRSVQRLETLAGRYKKDEIIGLFKKAAAAREKDYPAVASDALAALMRIGGPSEAAEAERILFAIHTSSAQAAAIRWERGWRAWKEKRYRDAYDQWSAGYSHDIENPETASRLLYWQMRALEKLNSPIAAERIKNQLVSRWPAEYYTFLASPDGGIKSGDAPEKYVVSDDLSEWGFVTDARLASSGITSANVTSEDIPVLYRSARLALWNGDFPSAVRTFSVMRKALPPDELAAAEMLKISYPQAFKAAVEAASDRTGTPQGVIWGVMRQESVYEPNVTSSAGAYGLMQLMPATAKDESKKMAMSADAYLRPADNILLGANYLAWLFARFKQAPLALAAYNAGGSPVSRWSKAPITDMAEWVEDIAYRETRGYVKAVLRNIEVYKLLYAERGGSDGD